MAGAHGRRVSSPFCVTTAFDAPAAAGDAAPIFGRKAHFIDIYRAYRGAIAIDALFCSRRRDFERTRASPGHMKAILQGRHAPRRFSGHYFISENSGHATKLTDCFLSATTPIPFKRRPLIRRFLAPRVIQGLQKEPSLHFLMRFPAFTVKAWRLYFGRRDGWASCFLR